MKKLEKEDLQVYVLSTLKNIQNEQICNYKGKKILDYRNFKNIDTNEIGEIHRISDSNIGESIYNYINANNYYLNKITSDYEKCEYFRIAQTENDVDMMSVLNDNNNLKDAYIFCLIYDRLIDKGYKRSKLKSLVNNY